METIKCRNGSMLLGNSWVNIPGVRKSWSSDGERMAVIEDCIDIWNATSKNAGNPRITGLTRFDLDPQLNDEGMVSVKSIFEINKNSPECIAVGAAAYYAGFQDEYLKIINNLAEKIRNSFGNEIIFVPGKCYLKDYYGMYFLFALRKAGLNVRKMLPWQVIKSDKNSLPPVLLWGDVRTPPGECQFDDYFIEWLYANKDDMTIFNSLDGREMANKNFLPEKWAPRFDIMDLGSIDREEIVLKPNGGASGNGIYFGRHYVGRDSEWRAIVDTCQDRGDYVAWKAQWLPRLNGYAFDLNMSFWVKDGVLIPENYLYSIIRVDMWDRYWEQGVINVAKGAGALPPFI